MSTKPNQALLIFFFLSISGILFSQQDSTTTSLFDHLTSEEGGTLLLELEMKTLLNNRKSGEYFPARLTDASGKAFDMQVRTRGKFRRRRCEIPPIKIKFSKSVLRKAGLDTLNEIKLVLPCADKAAYEQLIVREYVAYRMFETLNPHYSTRARLIRLHLKDFKRKRPKKMYALLVEHEEQVSARTRGTVVAEWGVQPQELNTEQTALMTLFQYMIGNTDWETTTCRNIMLIQPPDSSLIRAVPYDFDFSGLVSAPYASPSSESGLLTVKDRYLMSANNGVQQEALQEACQLFLAHKAELLAWCRNKHLSKYSIREMDGFLQTFFDVAESNEAIPVKLEVSNN